MKGLRFKDYFDENFLMDPYGENAILFTCEYVVLMKINGTPVSNEYIEKALHAEFTANGGFEAIHGPKGEPYSHDNFTAITCLTTLIGHYNGVFFFKDWYRRLQPWNLIFYLYRTNKIMSFLIFPFLWILSLKMIYDVTFDRYKNINGLKVLATDAKLLTFIRLYSVDFPITKKICNFIMKKRGTKFHQYFRVYFPSNHPNIILSRELDV